MTFSIFTHDTTQNERIKKELTKQLTEIGMKVEDTTPDLVFTIGGDGTVLKAVHHYVEELHRIKFIGIHTGHLGYYTDWLPEEIENLAAFVAVGGFRVDTYKLLKAKIYEPDLTREIYALNEFTLINPTRTQHLNVTIDDLFFESFRGTGVCVSTPTGSTAYNKALGGALINPQVDAYQMTEIASINSNAYRTIGSPLIFPKGQKLRLRSENWEDVTLTQDHLVLDASTFDTVEIDLSDVAVQFVKRDDKSIWNRVKESFL